MRPLNTHVNTVLVIFARMGDDIKCMKLYSHLERVDRELAEMGFTKESELKAQDIFAYDHMNYYGTEAVQAAITACGIKKTSKILDIGSGLGGPARFIHLQTGAGVVALELQDDCNRKAQEYTTRCGMGEKIEHICTDFVNCDLSSHGLNEGIFDFVVSWLVILHIEQKKALFDRVAFVTSPGGQIFIEDFYEKNPFTKSEIESLKRDVFCSSLISRDTYTQMLTDAGYTVVAFDDLTDKWTDFVVKRQATYVENKERTLKVHGQETYDTQLYFFKSVRDLFSGGNLGGCRIRAMRA